MRKRGTVACLVVLLILLILVPSSYAQRTRLRVDGDRIKSYIEWLSRDEMQGRQSCTEGYRKAAEWAADNFKRWGLQPAGENGTYFQNVPIGRSITLMTGMPDLRVDRQMFLMEEGDFSLHPASTAATSVNSDVVFVGYGICAPGKGLDEYADLDVEGKVDILRFAAGQLRALSGDRIGEFVVFEDAPSGIAAAKSLGCYAVGVLRIGEENALRQAGADIVVTDLKTVKLEELL